MGVTHLWSVLAPVQKRVTLGELRGQTLAVDLGLWICEMQFISHNPMSFQTPYLRTLYFRIMKLRQAGIKLVFVADGEATDIKLQTLTKRYKKESADVISEVTLNKLKSRRNFRSVLKQCTQLLDALGIPHLESEGEGEKLCAILNLKGCVDGVITNDGDAFLYGAQRVLRNLKMGEREPSFELFEAQAVKQQLGLSREHLISFGILVGCDYIPKGVPGIGKENAVRFLNACSKPLHFFNEAYKISKDGEHCSVCKHLGTSHLSEGCRECKTSTLCSLEAKKLCSCLRHKKLTNNNHTLIFTLEKCVIMSEFPFKPIVKEFLDFQPGQITSRDSLTWRCPSIRMFKTFASLVYLWEADYCLQQFINNCTAFCLNHEQPCKTSKCRDDCLEGKFYPLKIVKRRRKNNEDHLEVVWSCPSSFGTVFEHINSEETLSSVEKLVSVKERFPHLLLQLEQSESEKSSKSKKRKVKAPVPDKENVKNLSGENQIDFKNSLQNAANLLLSTDGVEEDDGFRRPGPLCLNPKTPACAKFVDQQGGGLKRSQCFSPNLDTGPPVSSTPRITFTPYRGVSPETYFRYVDARGKGSHSPIRNGPRHDVINGCIPSSAQSVPPSPSPYLNVEESVKKEKRKPSNSNPISRKPLTPVNLMARAEKEMAAVHCWPVDVQNGQQLGNKMEMQFVEEVFDEEIVGLAENGIIRPSSPSPPEQDSEVIKSLGSPPSCSTSNGSRPLSHISRSNGIQYSSPWYDEDSIPMGERASDEDEDVVCLEDLPLRERLRLQNIQCNDV